MECRDQVAATELDSRPLTELAGPDLSKELDHGQDYRCNRYVAICSNVDASFEAHKKTDIEDASQQDGLQLSRTAIHRLPQRIPELAGDGPVRKQEREAEECRSSPQEYGDSIQAQKGPSMVHRNPASKTRPTST